MQIHLCASFLLLSAAASLAAAQPTSAPGLQVLGRVRLELEHATGIARATFTRPQGGRQTVLTIPPIRIDGALQLGFEDQPARQDGPLRCFANPIVRVEFTPLGPASTAITWSAGDGAVHDFEIAIADNSAYYGGGERFGSLNHKGQILPMASIDRPEDKGVVSYKPIPYFMSTRGYAVWLDSPAPALFDFNATDRERVLIRCRAARVRLVLIDGPDFGVMLAEFTRLTGRPRVPPAWAFAPWKSRNIHNNRDEVLADAELTRRHDLPGSVIVIDSPWETGYNDFILNERQFTEPVAMFARLRELGFYPCLWLTPFVNVENVVDTPGIDAGPCRNFAAAAERGYLVKRSDGQPMIASWWKGRGALVDFTNPAAVQWWHGQIEQAQRWGVRALKCDDGEGNFVQDAVFFDGTPAAEMKNRYAALYLHAAQEYIDTRLAGDGVLLARCGFTGTQAQPFCWAGDNEANFSFENGLPSVVLAGQNAALSGLPLWGHDIAGYIGRPSRELFIRWTQFGAFSPLMQIHMTSNLGPWDFDEQTLAIYRTFARLHTALFPYIYDAAHEAARSGMPIIRPMVLAFPNDPAAAAERYQYMFGPDLLVAPLVQPGEHRAVYLPRLPDGDAPRESDASAVPATARGRDAAPGAAAWIDYWTGRSYAGGQTLEVHAPLERMPLFVRSGALICMLPDDVDTLIPRHADMAVDVRAIDERRLITVWPGPPRSLTTYDGITVTATHTAGQTALRMSAAALRTIELRRVFITPATTSDEDADGWTFEPETDVARRSISIGPQPVEIGWRQRPQ